MRSTDAIGDYAAWMRNAIAIELEPGLVVHVGSASDLLAAKEVAGRHKDHAALPRIRAELLRAGALDAADVRGPVAPLATEAPADPRAADLLGPRPEERRARGLWDHGADLIAAHRERWDIPIDTHDPLGTAPNGSAQQADRTTLERQLERTTRLLARLGYGRDEDTDALRIAGASFPTQPEPQEPSSSPTADRLPRGPRSRAGLGPGD